MFTWLLTFLIMWLVWGIIGFALIADTGAWIARGLSIIFLLLSIMSLVTARRSAHRDT